MPSGQEHESGGCRGSGLESVGDLEDIDSGDADRFGVCPPNSLAEQVPSLALIVSPGQARLTLAAGDARVDHDSVAEPETGHTIAEAGDLPCSIGAQDVRELEL